MPIKKFHKRQVYAALMLVGVVLLSVILGQNWIENYIKGFLSERIPNHYELRYSDLQVNIIRGSMVIEDVSLHYFDRDSSFLRSRFSMDKLGVTGVSLWQYLVNNVIDIKGVLLENPKVSHKIRSTPMKQDSSAQDFRRLLKAIHIGSIEIDDGIINLKQENGARKKLEARVVNLTLTDVEVDSQTLKNEIPFVYDEISFLSKDVFVELGPYESVEIETINLQDQVLKCRELTVQSNYDKRTLSSKLKRERDHITLDIPEIELAGFAFGEKSGRFFVLASTGVVAYPKVEIYRDKLVADNLVKKPMYSRILRELPIDLSISFLTMKDGRLRYEERVHPDTKAGHIFFDHIEAKLQNISNTYITNEQTQIEARGLFMDSAPITLQWEFDVNNPNDEFLASGTILDFEAESINSFLEANLRTRAKGRVDEIYFTISGNSVSSVGDLKMNATDFGFVILEKDGLGINKLLTVIGNLFLRKGSKSEHKGYQHGRIEVERDPTKSFFNYLWTNVGDGLVSALRGEGEQN